MKLNLLGLASLFGLFLNLTRPLAHDGVSRVAINFDQLEAQAGTLTLQFDLVDQKDKKILADSDLNVVHEKKVHLFVFDPALVEFRHEHPEYINGKWEVTVHLPRNANYWVWVQGEIARDQERFSSGERLKIIGGDPEYPDPPVLGNLRSGTNGTSKIELSDQKINAKKMVMLTVKLSRTDGTKPSLSPYLGEMAHVVGVFSDGDSLLHIHPMSTNRASELMLHTTFPEAGDYRLWVQFIDGGVLKVIPLSVTVLK